MADYRVIGAEESPYSVKVRSYLRYKGLPHQWLTRTQAQDLYQQHAKLPLVPLVVTPQETALQDSTPIIETIEASHPEPSIYPADPTARFVCTLLEEFGDEWGNKWMFHYRWAREVDQIACSRRLAAAVMPEAQGDADKLDAAAKNIRERMVDRVWFVGSSPQTAMQIENSFKDALTLLEPHLATRPYLFGGRPSFADFALWGQIYNAHRDPTPQRIIETSAPNTLAWIERMLQPVAEGEFADWQILAPTLTPLLADQVGPMFLQWSAANAAAINNGTEDYVVQLPSGAWQQKPQKYHARSLAVLREKYAAAAGSGQLVELMQQTGCHEWLT